MLCIIHLSVYTQTIGFYDGHQAKEMVENRTSIDVPYVDRRAYVDAWSVSTCLMTIFFCKFSHLSAIFTIVFQNVSFIASSDLSIAAFVLVLHSYFRKVHAYYTGYFSHHRKHTVIDFCQVMLSQILDY